MEARALLVEEVDQGEGDIAWVPSQNLAKGAGGFRDRLRLDCHLAQRLHAPVGQHATRALGTGIEDPTRTTVLVADRAVRERVVGLFQITGPEHLQEEVFGPSGLAGLDDLVHHRADDVPDLRPAFLTRTAEKLRVLPLPQHRPVAVVVEHPALRPPPQDDGMARAKADAHGRTQALGPRCDRTERSLRPVRLADELRHLAFACEYLRSQGRPFVRGDWGDGSVVQLPSLLRVDTDGATEMPHELAREQGNPARQLHVAAFAVVPEAAASGTAPCAEPSCSSSARGRP